jgi:hypothetical protein
MRFVFKGLKWHAFTPASVHSPTPTQVSQRKTPTKIINRTAVKGKEKCPRRVLTGSPIIQKKTLKPNIARIISSKWFTIRTRAILINMMTVAAANNVRNANTRGMRLYKVFIL